MFGRHHRPPEPPKFEPFLIVLVAVLIAAALTLGFYAVMAFFQRSEQSEARFSPGSGHLASVLGATAGRRAEEGSREADHGLLTVEKSVENFRDGPKGRKLGTMLEGTQVEKISQEGRWVRFRLEAWVWGPSLDGFEEEQEPEATAAAPRVPLQDSLPRIKRLINDNYGVFYGVNLDEIMARLVVRFRVRSVEREALERRQMAVQREVLEILEGEVEFDSIRIENNRPDGSGPVGTEMAETEVGDIRRYAAGPTAPWKAHTRISSDGGETWSEEAKSAPTE